MPFIEEIKQIKISTVFWAVSALLFLFYLNYPNIQNGGDIIEYYGATESILSHGGVNLTQNDQASLSKSVSPGYFKDNQYYLEGVDGQKYPVHFIAYSLFNVPVRAFLRLLGQNERMTFVFTNLVILAFTVWMLLTYFVKKPWMQALLLGGVYLSPLLSFLSWPGPDVMIVCLLLVSLFLFHKNHFFSAIALASVASWQSQPLIIIPFGYYIYAIYAAIKYRNIRIFITSSLIGLLAIIPNMYNVVVFGVVSPWTLFGGKHLVSVSNITLSKFGELFFDPNIGLFWYMPIMFSGALIIMLKKTFTDSKTGFILIILLAVGIAYETNANWNNGTAGYGPTRYAIYLIPFILYYIVVYLPQKILIYVGIVLFILTQIWVFFYNGFLTPTLANTLTFTPLARKVLTSIPHIYNPTPEIFVERTLHTEPDQLMPAFYSKGGICKKIFIPKGVNEANVIPTCQTKSGPTIMNIPEGTYLSYE